MGYVSLLCSILMIVFSFNSVALESDKQEPIQIESDTLQYDSETKLSVYKGNVHFKQGSRKLLADHAEVMNDDKGIKRLTAEGKPATYREELDDKTTFTAEARKIIYDIGERKVELIEEAILRRNQDTFTAPHILYHLNTKQLETKGGRTRMVVYPKKPSPEKHAAHD